MKDQVKEEELSSASRRSSSSSVSSSVLSSELNATKLESGGAMTDDEQERPRSLRAQPQQGGGAPRLGVMGAPRVRRRTRHTPRYFRSKADFRRFDRPDMFEADVFPFSGCFLAPDRTGTHPATLPADPLPRGAKIVRLSVEPGIPATAAELFKTLQKMSLKNKALPREMTVRQRRLTLEYEGPAGDEMAFGPHSQDLQLIGCQFIGQIYISHFKPTEVPTADNTDHNAWQMDWTYKTWHKPLPLGGSDIPKPHTLPKQKLSQQKGSKTVKMENWKT